MTARRKLDDALDYGRNMQPIHELQDAGVSAAADDIVAILDVSEIDADAQPKKITLQDLVTAGGGGGGGTPGGSDTQIQFNDGGAFGGSADLTWDDTAKELGVGGDINLDDGGTYSTTLQMVTATANRTISFPDATGTVALVAGSSGQFTYNNAGAQAGLTSANIGSTGEIDVSLAGAASTPPVKFTGTWFTGGTATTTKPQVLIEPAGTTSTAWSTSGTGLGVNAASGFTGNLLDLQLNGSGRAYITPSFARFGDANHNLRIGSNAGATVDGYFATSLRGRIGFGLGTGHEIQITAGTPGGTLGPLTLVASVVEQKNGTNAQTYRLYNTYTDASNYERGFLQWNSNVFEIGSEGAGTGSEQPVRITAATLKLPNLPTYADNTAATSGGLVAGDVYKTATGELRITV